MTWPLNQLERELVAEVRRQEQATAAGVSDLVLDHSIPQELLRPRARDFVAAESAPARWSSCYVEEPQKQLTTQELEELLD